MGAIFFVLRVPRVPLAGPKEKESTADDEGYSALSKYVSFFFPGSSEHLAHPGARAPLYISMHRHDDVARACLCACACRRS